MQSTKEAAAIYGPKWRMHIESSPPPAERTKYVFACAPIYFRGYFNYHHLQRAPIRTNTEIHTSTGHIIHAFPFNRNVWCQEVIIIVVVGKRVSWQSFRLVFGLAQMRRASRSGRDCQSCAW